MRVFLKAHNAGYTRSDGVYVRPFDDKRKDGRKALWYASAGAKMGEALEQYVLQEGDDVDVLAWHGTASENLASILRDGLRPQKWKHDRSRKTDIGKVFIAGARRDARWFAASALDEFLKTHPEATEAEAVVLAIRLPAEERERVEWGMNGIDGFANVVGGFPPDWIVGYQVISRRRGEEGFVPGAYTSLRKSAAALDEDDGALDDEAHCYAVLLCAGGEAMQKAHVKGYVKKDGTAVKDHERSGAQKVLFSHGGVKAPQYGLGLFGGLFAGGAVAEKDWPNAKPHPAVDDKGRRVTINEPDDPTGPETWADGSQVALFVPGGEVPEQINGVALAPWADPPSGGDWDFDPGVNDDLAEPSMRVPAGKSVASGVIILEPDGRVWLVRPTNGYGGYETTFPKGKEEAELSWQGNAIKEAFEESGLRVRITGLLGDFERTTSVTRYYVAERVGGSPAAAGWESQGVVLAPAAALGALLHGGADKPVVAAIAEKLLAKK